MAAAGPLTERRVAADRRTVPRGSERRRGRPRLFDGTPISVRLPRALHDAISLEAIRRGVDLAVVIRERLARNDADPHFVSQNARRAAFRPQ
jgi:hypothetical protein